MSDLDGAVVSVGPVTRWTDEQTSEFSRLTEAVYPPEEQEGWAGASMEWARPEIGVRVVDSSGWLVSYVGVLIRQATHDGEPVTIGGIGGVKTHPDARGMGYASLGMDHATAWLLSQPDVDFGLLVCKEDLLTYYGNMGWKEFTGTLMTIQHGAPAEFTFNRVMTRDLAGSAPTGGLIDLQGPPW